MIQPPRQSYCSKCCIPLIAATPVSFDKEQVCSGCRTHEEQSKVDWARRGEMFADLCDECRGHGDYDCLIPVSGGKDSFYQCHIMKQHDMKALLVCYNENNETEVGKRNIQRMKDAFGFDYINVTPSIDVLKKLNRVGLRKCGDTDMHAHMGINAVPVQMAVKFNIPLVVWGEHGFMELGGMHSYKDLVEYTTRYRVEHLLRGYDWQDFVGEEGLTDRDLQMFKYPSDDEIERVDVRGIFVANYFGWRQSLQAMWMRETYGFEYNPGPMSRTYKRDSNLNNMHDGVHDYLKFIKFGYGRCTDHVCRDIRNGDLKRAEGVELIRQYDHVVPADLERWLDYVGMTRTEFDQIADGFRDPRVWVKNEYGHWIKDNIWEHN